MSKLIWTLAALALAGYLSTAVFTVDETESAVITRFGAPLAEVKGPGLHLKRPWPVDEVVRVDARNLVFDNEPMEMLTEDKKNVLVDSFLVWRIVDPTLFTQTVKGRGEAEARLLDISASEMGAAVGSFPLESFIQVGEGGKGLREVSRRVASKVDRLARESFGIEVVDLEVNGFNFPPQNRASVIKRMRAERATIATRYRSEGEEAALKIEADAKAESATILAEARSQAESIRGRGEAEALRVFAEAYNRDPELYRFLRRLETYETILDEDTTLFLESDSKLLRELDGP